MVCAPISGILETDTFRTVFHKLALATDTPFAIRCNMLLQDGSEESLKELVSSSVDPRHYREGDEAKFAGDYLMAKIASKLPPSFGSWNKLEPTLQQFCQQEDRNADINRQCIRGEIHDKLADIGISVAHLRSIVKMVLGRAPSLRQCCERGGWGPGSTVLRSRKDSVPEAKCSDRSITYRLAMALSNQGLHDCLPWWDAPWTLVPGNLMFTVPKNAKTLRTASAEPAINGWVQKGIGASIRKRLRKVGIDLNDQTINQAIALFAQRFGYSTIDLKGASNSIALEIIRLVLPADWMMLIEMSRSERGCFENRADCLEPDAFWFDYEMVSSMGNGFTFELESLLFYCIARAAGCHSDEVWVYGDDIIVPQVRVPKVVNALEIMGFSLNREKSFIEGLFFESCGVHVFNGCDVTPFYMKDDMHEPKDVLRIANELRLFATRLEYYGCRIRQYLPVYRYLVGRLPDAFRARGPAGGGLCLFSNIEEIRKPGTSFSGSVEYQHLLPCFEYNVNKQYQWSLDEVLAFELDKVRGPLPLVSPFKPIHRQKRSQWKRTASLQSIKALHRRYRKDGIGETPFLLDYRLFTAGAVYEDPDILARGLPIAFFKYNLFINPWEDVRDVPNSGNKVARVDYRKWTTVELNALSHHDRVRAGKLAHKVVTGTVDPGRVPTLTVWRE